MYSQPCEYRHSIGLEKRGCYSRIVLVREVIIIIIIILFYIGSSTVQLHKYEEADGTKKNIYIYKKIKK